MHKVIVERPRGNNGPYKQNRRANLPPELQPKFEGIRRAHRDRKWQRDLLGPLHRWLRAQLGRAWNDVFSDACQVVHPHNYVRVHVKTHLLQYVERNTFMHGGEVCVIGRRPGEIKPVTGELTGLMNFYVHPETGLLEEVKRRSRKERQVPQEVETFRWLRNRVALNQIRGLWFECSYDVVPVSVRFKAYDHVLERVVSRSELTRQDKQYLLCKSKRQLSRRELRRYHLRNDKVVGTQSSIGCIHHRFKTAFHFLAGRRFWIIGHRMLAVRIRPRVSMRVAQMVEATMLSKSLLACCFILHFAFYILHLNDGPKTSGYRLLVRIQSGAPDAPVAKWYSNPGVTPCPSDFVAVDSVTLNRNHQPGGSYGKPYP